MHSSIDYIYMVNVSISLRASLNLNELYIKLIGQNTAQPPSTHLQLHTRWVKSASENSIMNLRADLLL